MVKKTIKVGKDYQFKTINDAIKSIHGEATILLMDDFYYEKVVVDKPDITINGQNKAVISYDDYAKKIHKDGREYVTFRTYTMLVKAPNVVLENMTIQNTAGEGNVVGQAVALHLYNTNITCINCRLLAKQDTLFCGPFSPDLIERYVNLLPEDERVHNGDFQQYFFNCYIEGTVDFIFGGANATFIDCKIVSLPTPGDSYVCAPDHDKENNKGMLFLNCNFIKGKDTKDKSVYLARPWREYGYVTFDDCYLDSHIKDDGFSVWENTSRHLTARFYEIHSIGPGANKDKRVSWAHVR